MAFVLASVGTLVGTAVAWMALSQRLGPGGWQVSSVCFERDGFPSRYNCAQRLHDSLSLSSSDNALQLAAALTASYIGGSINFAAVSASLATPGPLVAAAMAAGITPLHLCMKRRESSRVPKA